MVKHTNIGIELDKEPVKSLYGRPMKDHDILTGRPFNFDEQNFFESVLGPEDRVSYTKAGKLFVR